MPKPVLVTYGKKRSVNDYQNSMFDRLIQDVSNNTIKKCKVNTPFKNDKYDFMLDDEDDLKHDLKHKNRNVIKEETLKFRPSFFRSNEIKSPSPRKNSEISKKNSKYNNNTNHLPTRNSSKKFKNTNENDSDANKSSSSVQSSNCSVDNSFVDEQLANYQNVEMDIKIKAKEKTSPPAKLFMKTRGMEKSKSLNAKMNKVEEDDIDDIYDIDRPLVLKTTKMQKSNSLQSPDKTSNDDCIDTSPKDKKFTGIKKIFSNNQIKRNNAAFNYNLFDFSDTTMIHSDSNTTNVNNEVTVLNDNKTQSTNATTSKGITKKTEEFTLLRDPRKAYECEELGETQSIMDDTSYLMDGLSSNFQLANRCMSALKLAEYCVNSEFRMHLRSHGTVAKIFGLLQDSPKDHNLALCAACIMYALSRDKLVMDIDKTSLELMIMILNMDMSQQNDIDTQLYKKNYKYCTDICTKLENITNKNRNTNEKLDLNNLNANLLAMECLLSLTNRRAGDWCKEELRILGAFDHILNTIEKCIKEINMNLNFNIDDFDQDDADNKCLVNIKNNLLKYVRCMKVLENVTHANQENQDYLCFYKNSLLIKLFKESLSCFISQLSKMTKESNEIQKCYSEALKTTFFLMVNITHENANGAEKIVNDENLVKLIFICVHESINYLKENEKFDVLIMALGVILNLLHINKEFQQNFIRDIRLTNGQNIQSLDIIIRLFNKKQNDVVKAETDQEKEWDKLNNEIELQNVENINLTVMNSIHKAGKHMEDHIIAAHSAVILGYILTINKDLTNDIKMKLNNTSFEDMFEIIKKFFMFMKIMKVTGFSADERIKEILKTLENLNKK